MKKRCGCSNGECGWDGGNVRCIPEELPETTTTAPTTIETTTEERECPALHEDNGEWECENSFFHGSKCQLHCVDGWRQVRTVTKCKCDENRCEWIRPARVCEAEQVFVSTTVEPIAGGICSDLHDPIGNWHCSHEYKVGSRCKLECPADYIINS